MVNNIEGWMQVACSSCRMGEGFVFLKTTLFITIIAAHRLSKNWEVFAQ